MSYAVMPLSDYKTACDKVREKVDITGVKFEETDFGFLRSEVFTVPQDSVYIFSYEFSDPSKFPDLYYSSPEWEGETSPGYFEPIDSNSAETASKLYAGVQYRIFIADSLGLTPKDILKASLLFGEETVVDFVPPPKIKSGELAEKVDKVYMAGAEDFGYKVKVEGNPATLNYVHPKEHNVAIKTTATDHKVYIRGKNLLNLEGREVVNFGAGAATTKRTFFNEKAIILGLAVNNNYANSSFDFEITKNTISCIVPNASYGMGFDVKLLPNTTYRFSCSERTEKTSVRLIEYDAEGNYIKNTTIINNSVTTSAKAAWGVFMFKDDTANYEHYISNPQLEYGSKITEYEPPIPETEFTANANGTVEGVKSISPTMNITTDKTGAVINAECFLDPQAVITDLTNTVITLGGEV